MDRMGVDTFKADVEERLGWKLEPARPYHFTSNIDKFGWSTGYNGKHHFTIFIENGRVEDIPGKEFKTGLREIAKAHKGKFRLTANQHLVLADVTDAELPLMKKLLAKFGLDNYAHSGLRLSSSACVAFPTCGTRLLPKPVPPTLMNFFLATVSFRLSNGRVGKGAFNDLAFQDDNHQRFYVTSIFPFLLTRSKQYARKTGSETIPS
jgi:hypothetical protein